MQNHKGMAASQGHPQAPVGHAASPDVQDPRRARCTECDRPITYRRRTYGPHGRSGGWTHIGDGLVQYRSWR